MLFIMVIYFLFQEALSLIQNLGSRMCFNGGKMSGQVVLDCAVNWCWCAVV